MIILSDVILPSYTKEKIYKFVCFELLIINDTCLLLRRVINYIRIAQ